MARPVTITLVGDRLAVAAAFQQLDEMVSEVTTEQWTEVPRGPVTTESPARPVRPDDSRLDAAVERAAAQHEFESVPVDVLRVTVEIPSTIARDVVATVLHNHLTNRTRPVQVVVGTHRLSDRDDLEDLQQCVWNNGNPIAAE
jgi:hypothetical protein